VRLAVRNVSKGQELVHLFDSNPRLQLAVVPDLQKSTSFSEAIKGVSAIIHSASPFIVMTDNVERDLFEPAINITTAVLEAAFKEPSVKRIVLTSSFAAVVDLNRRFEYEYTYTEKDVNNFPKEDAIKEVPLSYEVSKSLAEKAAWSFIETRKPAFDLVVFNPVMIYGQPLQKFKTPLEINTSNLLTYALLYGAVPVNPLPFFV
jgi:nucleoside-diphosphate-sugar epimerase